MFYLLLHLSAARQRVSTAIMDCDVTGCETDRQTGRP